MKGGLIHIGVVEFRQVSFYSSDVLRHLYCHLRQHPDIPWQTKETMDFRADQ